MQGIFSSQITSFDDFGDVSFIISKWAHGLCPISDVEAPPLFYHGSTALGTTALCDPATDCLVSLCGVCRNRRQHSKGNVTV